MQFVTSCYGDAYAPFLAVCLRSLRNSNPGSRVLVVYDDIARRTIEALSESNPNTQFVHLALAPHTQDTRQRIGARMSFWLAGMERTQADEVIFLDCDTIVRSSLRDALPSHADALFTVKNEKVPINNGLVIIRRSDRTHAFLAEWERIIQQVCRQTSVDYSKSGGPSQHALLMMMGAARLEPGNLTLEAGGTSVTIHLAPCAVYNETNSVPLSSPAKVLHYKSGWHKILLRGSDYTRTRPRTTSMEMRRLWREHLRAEERATGLRLLPAAARLRSTIRDMRDHWFGTITHGLRMPSRDDVKRKWWELSWWARSNDKRVRIRNEHGVPILYCPEGRLEILSPQRWPHYKRGLDARLRHVAAKYGVPDIVSLRPGDLVVDIGANIGEFSLHATNAGASVIAIEADAFTFQRLCANTSQRDVTRIHKGLWEKPCMLQFNIDFADADGSFINPSKEGINIAADTLDNVLADYPGRIRFIKADVEGAEPELLRGALKTLERAEYIGIDCGAERMGQKTDAECEAILRDTGFEIVRRGKKVLVAKNTRLQA